MSELPCYICGDPSTTYQIIGGFRLCASCGEIRNKPYKAFEKKYDMRRNKHMEKKCSKTTTSKHRWSTIDTNSPQYDSRDLFFIHGNGYAMCLFCGLIDDRKYI